MAVVHAKNVIVVIGKHNTLPATTPKTSHPEIMPGIQFRKRLSEVNATPTAAAGSGSDQTTAAADGGGGPLPVHGETLSRHLSAAFALVDDVLTDANAVVAQLNQLDLGTSSFAQQHAGRWSSQLHHSGGFPPLEHHRLSQSTVVGQSAEESGSSGGGGGAGAQRTPAARSRPHVKVAGAAEKLALRPPQRNVSTQSSLEACCSKRRGKCVVQ